MDDISVISSVGKINNRCFFKSLELIENERAIVCSHSSDGILDCAFYDSTTNKFYNYTITGIVSDYLDPFNIIMEYIEETQEILIGMPSSKNEISLIKCSKDFECSDIYRQNLTDIVLISRVNIIYLSSENKYYAIATDSNNPGKFKFPLDTLLELRCKHYFNYDKTSCLS